MRALLSTLWQSDSAFPSGGFAFSNGIEGAVAQLGRLDADTLGALLVGMLRDRWISSDRVALLHAFRADECGVAAEIDRAYDAAMVVDTLRIGSWRNGASLLATHCRLGTEGAVVLRDEIGAGAMHGHLPIVQGWLWRRCGLDERMAEAASAYTAAATMTTAAVRLGAVGAIEAQRALAVGLAAAAELAERPFDAEAPLRFPSATLWLDIVSLRQSRADLRLFSN